MPSYRFCRPDDVPYLVRAVNECFDVHFPDAPPMTVDRFRGEMRALDLWPSNCMVASSDSGPIAVLIGTKRSAEVQVLRVGLRPGHQRRGHGAHLLTSLSQKLAVLGPETLLVEVPRALGGVDRFFAACGYRPEATYTDYTRPRQPAASVPDELILPITVEEIDDHGRLEIAGDVAWERRRETLLNRREGDLEGICIASPERIEAFVLSRISDSGRTLDVLAAVAPEPERRELLLSLLLRALAGRTELPLRLPKLAAGEVPAPVLEQLGFAAGPRYQRCSARACPA